MVLALAAVCVLIVLSLEALQASAAADCDCRSAPSSAASRCSGRSCLTRFDLYAAAVTLAAVCAILSPSRPLGSALLGVAIATKIYPAVLLPLLVTRIWRREGACRRAARARPDRRHGARDLPPVRDPGSGGRGAERLAAGGPAAADREPRVGRAARAPPRLRDAARLGVGAGSQNLTGTVASVASAVTTLAGVAALALVWVRFARGDTESAARFVRYAAAAIVAFVAFGKVALAAVPGLAPRRRRARPGPAGGGRNRRSCSRPARSPGCGSRGPTGSS